MQTVTSVHPQHNAIMPLRKMVIWGSQIPTGRYDVTGFKIGATALGFVVGVLAAAPASAWDRGSVAVLTVLPNVPSGGQSSVEGLTVGPDGNIYVPSFGFNTKGALTGSAGLFTIAPNGDILRKVTIKNASPHILGLGFNPVTRSSARSRFRRRRGAPGQSAKRNLGGVRGPDRGLRPQRVDLRQAGQCLCVGFVQRGHLEDHPVRRLGKHLEQEVPSAAWPGQRS